MNVYLIKSYSLRLLHDEINKIIGKSTNVIRINMDETTIDNIIQECAYLSFLDENKYVIVNNFKINKENSELEKYFKEPNPQTILILITDNIDKRTSIYKKINSLGNVIIIDEIKDIGSKINNYAKEKGVSIDFLSIKHLLSKNLNNYDLTLNEIDKIGIITNKIDKEIIDKYTYALIGEDNFEFCDAIIKKDYGLIKKQLNDFINLKCELLPFIGLLASQFRLIYTVKSLTGNYNIIAKNLNEHPYRVKLAQENGVRYSKDELQKILLDLCDLDYNIKTANIDKYMLFKIFIINL